MNDADREELRKQNEMLQRSFLGKPKKPRRRTKSQQAFDARKAELRKRVFPKEGSE